MTDLPSSSSSSSSSSSHDLFSYLESLDRTTLLRLYDDAKLGPYACRAVLQRLPELARQYVMRLTFTGGCISKRHGLDLWYKHKGRHGGNGNVGGTKETMMSMKRMEHLCVIEPTLMTTRKRKRKGEQQEDDDDDDDDDGAGEEKKKKEGDEVIKLTPEFLKGIQASLTNLTSAPWEAITPKQRAALEAAAAMKDPQQQQQHSTSSSKKNYLPPPTLEQLEMFTQRRWDSVLHFLVGSDGSSSSSSSSSSLNGGIEDPPGAVILFLEKTGLMQPDPEFRGKNTQDAPLVITSRGYEFMLQDVHVQVWSFIMQYFKSLEQHRKCNEIRLEALLFLIGLSYCKVGHAYPVSELTKDFRVLMQDFSQFGLLYVCRIGGLKVFYPTRVAVNLVTGSLDDQSQDIGVGTTAAAATAAGGGGGSAALPKIHDLGIGPSASATRALEEALSQPIPSQSHLAIIVQTNFQLCAYTTSELHVSMLGLFCDICNFRRLPNVIFYKITRDSVKSAFKLGIEAKQILRFLKMHAHPRLRTGDQPLIPSNVEDQILLWDRERHRVQFHEIWVHQCQSSVEYEAVRQYALDCSGYAWCSSHKNKVLIKYEKAEEVMAFIRRWRVRAAQRQATGGHASFA